MLWNTASCQKRLLKWCVLIFWSCGSSFHIACITLVALPVSCSFADLADSSNPCVLLQAEQMFTLGQTATAVVETQTLSNSLHKPVLLVSTVSKKINTHLVVLFSLLTHPPNKHSPGKGVPLLMSVCVRYHRNQKFAVLQTEKFN